MNTTADSWNRIRDKQVLEYRTGLTEEGNETRKFYSKKGTLLAKGYIRIVYGDHGPYIEFDDRHLIHENWKIRKIKGARAWYDECEPIDGSRVTLYVQKKPVTMLPNPPKGKYSARNNRKEGYADYKVGMLYISPDDLICEVRK